EGENMGALKAVGLPEGLKIGPGATETKAEIIGTPTELGTKNVTVEAEHEGETTKIEFKWAVVEPAPAVTPPAPPPAQAGVAITPVEVTGERMAELTAEGLPKGLTLKLESETKAVITGTPEQAESPVVTLKAKNKEGAEASTTFEWKIEPE